MTSTLRLLAANHYGSLLLLLLLMVGSSAAVTGKPSASLAGVLNADGTLRPGARGSFDATGYTLGMAPTGQPMFRPVAARRPQHTLGAGDANWSTAFQGVADGSVTAIAVDGQGNLYVGGRFSTTGTVPANNIARWNGTTWSALGAGITGIPNVFNYSDFGYAPVNALAVDGAGNLYAGGAFNSNILTRTESLIRRWSGTAWTNVGTGTNGSVYGLAPSGTGLYVGGYFTATGDNSVAMRNIGYYANAALATTASAPLPQAPPLYPNPAHLTATVRLPAGSPKLPLTLSDAQGRIVRHYPVPGTAETVLDLRGLPAGLYVLRGAGSSQKLVVE